MVRPFASHHSGPGDPTLFSFTFIAPHYFLPYKEEHFLHNMLFDPQAESEQALRGVDSVMLSVDVGTTCSPCGGLECACIWCRNIDSDEWNPELAVQVLLQTSVKRFAQSLLLLEQSYRLQMGLSSELSKGPTGAVVDHSPQSVLQDAMHIGHALAADLDGMMAQGEGEAGADLGQRKSTSTALEVTSSGNQLPSWCPFAGDTEPVPDSRGQISSNQAHPFAGP